MADLNTIGYTVTGYDEQNMVIFVDFNGEGHANIGLRGRFPETQTEMDALVKPYAPHKEVVAEMATLSIPTIDFVKSTVGKSFETERFGETPKPKLAINELSLSVQSADLTNSADAEFIRNIVKEEIAKIVPVKV